MNTEKSIAPIVDALKTFPSDGTRRLLAVVGPPGAGKSTLAEVLCEAIKEAGYRSEVVPMDGFHLDDRILEPQGLLPRKGSPQTFDAAGFLSLVQRLANQEAVYAPVFDRTREISIAGAVYIPAELDWLIIEGNYLLLDQPIWRDLKPYWDFSVRLDVPMEELERRLIERWLNHGYSPEKAAEKAKSNDLINAVTISEQSLEADLNIDSTG